jgi:hypothetical protein
VPVPQATVVGTSKNCGLNHSPEVPKATEVGQPIPYLFQGTKPRRQTMTTSTSKNAPETLSDTDLDTVVGGLNPQPLPPRWRPTFVNPVISYSNRFQRNGIIIIGG